MNKILNAKGESIPFIGLGTFPFQGREMAEMIKAAIKVGYRLFDTADDYRGETGIGLAIKELSATGVCKREDLFLQTKISENAAHEDEPLAGIYFNPRSKFMHRHTVDEIVREKVNDSLRKMNTDYLDSLLIHLPYPGYIDEIWESMVQLQKEGKVRYIGVSNFHKRHIESIVEKTGVKPAFNEIYISPIGSKQDQVDYNNANGITIMTYSPLMDLASNRIHLDKIKPIMEKYQKSPAQIILRWNIERGCLPLPKTKNPKRLAENFDIFDFSLTQEEVSIINALNYDYQYLPESKICPGL